MPQPNPAVPIPSAAAPRRNGWWRWPLLTVLVGATLTAVVAYGIWFFTTDLDEVASNFSLPAARVVDLTLALNGLFWVVPGLVVLRRARWHPVGWMLAATGLGYALSFDMAEPAVWRVLGIPDRWAAWVADGWGNSVSFAFTAVLLCVFPDGLPRDPQERRWAKHRIGLALVALVAAGLGTTVGGHEGASFATAYPNPTGLGLIPQPVAGWTFLAILVSMAGSAIALWRRSRRADESRRRQFTWVLFPFALLTAIIVVSIPLSSLLGDSVWLGAVSMYFLVPIAFSIAIVRQRLFDIDRLVSRTVGYGIVAMVIAVVYVVPVVVLPDVLGLSSDLAVALATLGAAAAFAPLRSRVQRRVARRFDRAHYDAERIVLAVSGRIQSVTDRAAVSVELGGAAAAALRPRMVSVWLRGSGS